MFKSSVQSRAACHVWRAQLLYDFGVVGQGN